MKADWLNPLRDWFGYTRRERRATFILLIAIVVIALARYIIPGRSIEVEQVISPEPITVLADTGESPLILNKPVSRQRNAVKQFTDVDLNSCDSASLEALPGIGPVLAARIIKYRNLLGGFFSPVQLREVYGLPEETYNLISGRVTADSAKIRKIRINSADYRQIIRLPYFDRNEVSAILNYRKEHGPLGSIRELVDNNLIARDKEWKIRPYLEFE